MDFRLGQFEIVTLAAIIALGGQSGGALMRHEITQRAGREPSLGALYTTLSRLERRGLVASHKGNATPRRGGRAKRVFCITDAGRNALENSVRQINRAVAGVLRSE